MRVMRPGPAPKWAEPQRRSRPRQEKQMKACFRELLIQPAKTAQEQEAGLKGPPRPKLVSQTHPAPENRSSTQIRIQI